MSKTKLIIHTPCEHCGYYAKKAIEKTIERVIEIIKEVDSRYVIDHQYEVVEESIDEIRKEFTYKE